MAAHLALAMALGCCLLSSPGVMAKAHKTLLIPGPIEFHEEVLAVSIARAISIRQQWSLQSTG